MNSFILNMILIVDQNNKFFKKKKFDIFYYLQEKSNLLRETRDYLYFKLLGIKEIRGFFEVRLNYLEFNESPNCKREIKKLIITN